MPEKISIEELIIRYLSKDIREKELKELYVWIQDSEENKRQFFKLKNIHDSFQKAQLMDENEIEDSWNRMCSKINLPNNLPDTYRRKKTIYKALIQYAAVILITFTIGWSIGKWKATDMQLSSIEEITFNEINVEKGGKPNTLILSDGSKVKLNAATIFRYPTSFSDQKREVFLNGEAFFEVAGNEQKPFVVNLKQQSITVLGTEFNVEAYHESTYSIITLLSGKISLETFNKKGEAISQLMLRPNQKVFFNFEDETVSLENVDASLSNVWINGEYKFKDEPLLLIVKRLEKYYDVNIHLEDENLKKIRYTGTFSLNQSIRDVLHIINYERQFVYKKTGKDVFITPR